jgi:hypothetical protein
MRGCGRASSSKRTSLLSIKEIAMQDETGAFRRWLEQLDPIDPQAVAEIESRLRAAHAELTVYLEAGESMTSGPEAEPVDLFANTHEDVLLALEAATGLDVRNREAWSVAEYDRAAAWFADQVAGSTEVT